MRKFIYLLLCLGLLGCNTAPPPCPEQQRFGAVCGNGETSPLRDENACATEGGIKEWLCSDVPLYTGD